MADSDSDVVLEDSPLYQHWKYCNNEDLKATCKKSKEKISSDEVTLIKANSNLETVAVNIWTRLNSVVKDVRKPKIDVAVVNRLSSLVMDSSLLTEIDQSLLKNFTDEYTSKESNPLDSLVNRKHMLCQTFLSVTALFIAIFIYYFLDNISLCLALAISTICFLFFSYLRIFSSNVQRNEHRVAELLKDLKTLLQLLRKGIRTIQEAELIARGFTLISVRSPLNIESSSLPVRSPEQQCPELRETIFKYAREMFLTYRTKTLLLLGNFPLRANMDVTSHDLACVELSQLGELFSSKFNFSDEIGKQYYSDLTNKFSTSALKALVDIMEVQQSEMLRRLVFSFFAQVPSSDIWKIVNSCMEDLQHTVRDTVSVIQFVQLYFSCLTENDNQHVEQKPVKKKVDKTKPFQIAVHSLYLHLRAALIRIQTLEENVQTIDLSVDSSLKKFIVNMAKPSLNEIEAEVKASTMCFEECSIAANSLLAPLSRSNSEITGSGPVTPIKSSSVVKSPPIPLFEIGDPVIVDEVFEGSAEYVENGEDGDGFNYEKPAKNKCNPVNLMKELKSVLVVKAEEHKVREAKAMGIELRDAVDSKENDPQDSNSLPVGLQPEASDGNQLLHKLHVQRPSHSSSLDIVSKPREFKNDNTSEDISNASSLVMRIAAQAAIKSQLFNLPSQRFGSEEEFVGSNSEGSDKD